MSYERTNGGLDQWPRELEEAHWELPSYIEQVFSPKCHRFCLVIPVINEGSRIQKQLKQLAKENIPIDLVVADGGSTDGSLEESFLQEVGVNAILTKTGPGKLSAQLRMAYAWCIQKNYDGIVTIDGNGKDGLEGVAAMIAKLQDGYDYVQGSRYLPGGSCENTPFVRTIANRFIHAPLLSLSGRYWFTDTTNGFRAYSVKFLLHPKVQPFRSVFMNYELLFYLTARAGQLNMHICQIPVRRDYPSDGVIPSKIRGIRGKINIFMQTLAVAAGRFKPGDMS